MRLAVVFFIGATVGTLMAGYLFVRTKDRVMTVFGWGLGAIGIAFGFWTVARIIDPDDPDDLEMWLTIGVFFLLIGLIGLFWSWVQEMSAPWSTYAVVAAVAYIGGLVAVRFIYPSEPFIDADGVLFFNPHGSVAAMEVGAITVAALPGILAIGRRLKGSDAVVVQVTMTALMMGGIILAAAQDRLLITIASFAVGIALIAFLAVFLFRRPVVERADG